MQVKRMNKIFKADSNKVILQYLDVGKSERIKNVLNRINALSENEIHDKIIFYEKEFGERHLFFKDILLENFSRVEKFIEGNSALSTEKKLLIGSYFSKEYSIEAASLFNPSIVPHPDQSLLKPGQLRFLLSLRATGEGHISSIEFKSGIIDDENEIIFDSESEFSALPKKDNNKKFSRKFLMENLNNPNQDYIKNFPEYFTLSEVESVLGKININDNPKFADQIRQTFDLLDSNYKINFSETTNISERVIFPNSASESHGMEDVRIVRFVDDNNSSNYYGTYTAYNGHTFRTQLLETKDFIEFNVHTMHGAAVQDKGMALFPRKINGKYYITSRQGGENLQIMSSDNLYKWEKFELLQQPKMAWQYIQLGNCGSPIETEKGWLLITHAVGAFRKYTIGAMLLDLEKPTKILGSLKYPLLEPNEVERNGYVPNVLYSCGSLVHNGDLIIPYAMSDSYTGFAKVKLNELIDEIINE